MEPPETDIYQFADYYDILFQRNYAVEGDCLEGCLRAHGATAEQSFLELGCGPARNSRELSRRGYRAVGLDLQPNMLDYARAAAQREGVALELVQGDLIDFDLTPPVALAACLWDTIYLIVSNEQMVSHLRAVARNLLPGGVYVIETSHPRSALNAYSGSAYHGRVGDTEIEVSWGRPDDPYDCITQCYLVTVRMLVRRNGRLVHSHEMRLPQRCFQVQELRALIALSGVFAEVHFYGKTSMPLVPLSNDPECDSMLAVLVKK